ncbi:MAG: hypothetical protein JWO32_549 [Bacteroidetes bacterium]|nr:hypothetical protein [Bacteroidota bacterium]
MKKLYTLFLLVLFQTAIKSQVTITSVQSGNWNDQSTWNTLTVPGITDTVVIAGLHSVINDSVAICASLYVIEGGLLESTDNSTLALSGNFSNSGTYKCATGCIAFNGVTAQQVLGSTTCTFYDLIINNTNGVSLNSNLNLKNSLNIIQGIFNTTGFKLLLLSDSVKTAAVHPIQAGADLIGNISVQRYVSSPTTGWRFLGSPVKTTLQDWSDDFVTSGFPGASYPDFNFCSVYSYDETVEGTSDYGYVMPFNITDSIIPGVGYWCWVGPTSAVIEVTGKPAKFAQTFNVSLTPNAGKNEDGWNMIANPYASAIDWDSPSWSKTGIRNAVYVWDPVAEQYSTYINGTGANGGSNIIPSSGAFWVEACQVDAVLSCNELVKSREDKSFIKKISATSIKLKLSGNNYKDETVILFSAGASASVKPNEDATKLYSDNILVPSITTVADSVSLVINSLPMLNETIVPVKVKVGVSGVYTLGIDEACSMLLNSCLFIEDLVTGSRINLRTAFSYTFFINDTTTSPRFLLHFSKPLIKSWVDATCSDNQNGMAIAAIVDNKNWIYNWKDAAGNVLGDHVKSNVPDTLKNLAPGSYYVSASNKNSYCSYVQEEIIINSPEPLNSSVSIKDNTCSNGYTGEIAVGLITGGTMPYEYHLLNHNKMTHLSAGSYTLVLKDANGCSDTSVKVVQTLSVLDVNFDPGNDTTVYINELITFNNLSTGAIGYNWNFEGISSQSYNTSFAFTTPGTHTVILTANDNNCQSSVQKVIQVKNNPKNEGSNEINYGVNILSVGENASIAFSLGSPATATVSVSTVEGKIISVKHMDAFKNTESFGLGDSHGVYLVCVRTKDGCFTKKIIN